VNKRTLDLRRSVVNFITGFGQSLFAKCIFVHIQLKNNIKAKQNDGSNCVTVLIIVLMFILIFNPHWVV